MLKAAETTHPVTGLIRRLSQRPFISVHAFKGCEDDLCAALGVALPKTQHRMTHGAVNYLWVGPSSWFVSGDAPDLLETLSALSDLAAVTDQSDGHALFAISGQNARHTLAKLVPIDLHESVFSQDAVALTLAGHIGVKLWREDNDFILACFRSFGMALWHSLSEAAGDSGCTGAS